MKVLDKMNFISDSTDDLSAQSSGCISDMDITRPETYRDNSFMKTLISRYDTMSQALFEYMLAYDKPQTFISRMADCFDRIVFGKNFFLAKITLREQNHCMILRSFHREHLCFFNVLGDYLLDVMKSANRQVYSGECDDFVSYLDDMDLLLKACRSTIDNLLFLIDESEKRMDNLCSVYVGEELCEGRGTA